MDGKPTYKKHFKKFLVCFVVLLLIICVRAGFWQLDRADFKKEQAAQFNQSQLEKPQPFFNSNPEDYKKIIIKGTLSNDAWLIDNQLQNKKAGFKQLQLLTHPNTNKKIFVVLGWQKKFYDKPNKYQAITGDVTLTGTIKTISSNPYLDITNIDSHQKILPGIDKRLLSQLTTSPFSQYIIYAHNINSTMISSNSMTPNFDHNKHLGYAFQWFCFAFMLLAYSGYLILSSNKKANYK